MGNFSNNAITDNGRILLTEVMAGAIFTPTRIAIGSGNLPSGTMAQDVTNLVALVKNLTISKKEFTNDGKLIIGGMYNNADVTEAFYFRELGLFAKAVYLNEDGTVQRESEEVLYSYGNAGTTADLMPAYSTATVVEKQIDLVTWVGNTAQVDLTIASGVYATKEDVKNIENIVLGVQATVANVQNLLTAHTGNKNNPHGVTAAQVGARPSTWMPTAANVGAVSKNGDTMTGPLVINKPTRWGNVVIHAPDGSYRSVETDETRIRLDVRVGTASNNRHYLDLYNPTGRTFDKSLSLVKVTAGSNGEEIYDEEIVLHTGNMNLIDPSIFGGCKVETGFYLGTGAYGSSYPASITFTKGTPVLVVIQRENAGSSSTGIIIPQSGSGIFMTNSVVQSFMSSLSGRVLTWYHNTSNIYQLNENGATYRYTAFVV